MSRTSDIVKEVTWKYVAQDLTLAATLLKLHCQDCFVRVIHACLSIYIYIYIYIYHTLLLTHDNITHASLQFFPPSITIQST